MNKTLGRMTMLTVLSGLVALPLAIDPGSGEAAPSSAACRAEEPSWTTAAFTATAATSLSGSVANAWRDETVTIVAFCQATANLPAEPPKVVDGSRELSSVGGHVAGRGGRYVNYILYPPTNARTLTVASADGDLARVEFPALTAGDGTCREVSSPAVDAIGCGAMVVLRWQTRIDVLPDRVELVDGSAWNDTQPSLGFSLYDLTAGRQGLVITFAIERSEVEATTTEIKGLFVRRRDGRIGSVRYAPPVRESIRIVANDQA